MTFALRNREGSCLRESKDAEAAGNKDALRAFVRVRVRENRMAEAEKDRSTDDGNQRILRVT